MMRALSVEKISNKKRVSAKGKRLDFLSKTRHVVGTVPGRREVPEEAHRAQERIFLQNVIELHAAGVNDSAAGARDQRS